MNSLSKIDVLTRVEGHGSVELIRDGARVVDARLNLHEAPRLFEALMVGRRFDEIADIACRICSICSTVHKVAALQAVEQALKVTVSRQTGLLRELAVQGGQIESHALHIFCLALPDYLGVSGIQELAARAPEELKMGLRIKKLGNLIQEVVGGRAIHPFNLLVGGVGRVPDASRLQFLSDQLANVKRDVTASFTYIYSLEDILPPLPSALACAVSGGPPLFGDRLETSTAMTIHAGNAASWLNERVEQYSHAKVSGFDGKTTFMVGPLARLRVSLPVEYERYLGDTSIRSSLKARMIELQMAVGRAQTLVEQLCEDGPEQEPPSAVIPGKGEGVSLIEAPRGVLLHRYQFNEDGICSGADIITPTAINQGAMAASLNELIVMMAGAEYDEVKLSAEKQIRCYDPCISCAVH